MHNSVRHNTIQEPLQALSHHALPPCCAPSPPRQASRSCVLDILENILELAAATDPGSGSGSGGQSGLVTPAGVGLFSSVLQPWLQELLVALRGIVVSVWEGQAGPQIRVGC